MLHAVTRAMAAHTGAHGIGRVGHRVEAIRAVIGLVCCLIAYSMAWGTGFYKGYIQEGA